MLGQVIAPDEVYRRVENKRQILVGLFSIAHSFR
jgi:hypothetical protein